MPIFKNDNGKHLFVFFLNRKCDFLPLDLWCWSHWLSLSISIYSSHRECDEFSLSGLQSPTFSSVWGRVWEKSSQASWPSVAVMPALDMNAHVWLILQPWEFTTWRQWFTRPNPPTCLIPWGAGAEVGAKLGYPSVFLPSVLSLFSFFSSSASRPFCNLRLS